MLTVHHLGRSQSERVVWLCEELGIPYELKNTARDSTTMLAPADYKALHPIGAAPVLIDGNLVLAESRLRYAMHVGTQHHAPAGLRNAIARWPNNWHG